MKIHLTKSLAELRFLGHTVRAERLSMFATGAALSYKGTSAQARIACGRMKKGSRKPTKRRQERGNRFWSYSALGFFCTGHFKTEQAEQRAYAARYPGGSSSLADIAG